MLSAFRTFLWEMEMRLLAFVSICVYIVFLSFFSTETVRLWMDQLLQIFLTVWFPLAMIATIVLAIVAIRGSSRYPGNMERNE